MQVIDARKLKEMMHDDPHPTLVNTLPEKYFDDTKLPEAINIPQDDEQFAERVEEAAGSREQPVVVYCANQSCDSSTQAAKKLEEAGFSQVYDFEDGAEGWAAASQQAGQG